MNKTLAIGLGAVGLLGLIVVFTADEQSQRSAKPRQFTGQPLALPPGWDASKYESFVNSALGGNPGFNGQYYPTQGDSATLATVYHYQRDVWNGRTAAFVALYGTGEDATSFLHAGPWFKVAIPSLSGWTVTQVNRYGIGPQGFKSGIDVLTIIGTVGNYTLPNIPGVGSAANAVLQGSIALGRGESLENAAIAAARGALPPWGQVAFDLAVGLYSGNTSIDSAAVDAGLAYLESKYPGARAAYNEGRKAAQEAGLL